MTVATAIALGGVTGLAFGWLWRLIVPWEVHLRFWAATAEQARALLKVDDARTFFGLYRGLLRAVAIYVGRNLAGTLIAGAPLLAVLFAAPVLGERSEMPFFIAFVATMTVCLLWPSAKPS